MIRVSRISRNDVEHQIKMLDELHAIWTKNSAKLDANLVNEYVYKATTDAGTINIAVAVLRENKYCMYAPGLTDFQLKAIFKSFLREMDLGDHVFVFTERDYEFAKRYCECAEVDIQLIK